MRTTELDFKQSYTAHVAGLSQRMDRDLAMRQAIGGNFDAIGRLEYHLLRACGLEDGMRVIDVGCGSGRLAVQLTRLPALQYLGLDVVPDLVAYAEQLCRRPEWRFQVSNGVQIPEPDGSADFVVFFSVFTHLLHEETYRYLEESRRVLKPGGQVIFSFLEFRVPNHWAVFEQTLRNQTPGAHLNQFMDREGIVSWAQHLGFTVECIHGGDTLHIPLPEEVVFEDGSRQGNLGTMGQSVAVLRR